MLNNWNRNKLFWLILILAFVLRFWRLGEIPLTLDWDENSNAYNAYSIIKTGRDEYGTFLPITNRSFDDYKPPLYMYLNVPAVAIFGLTPFAARLPSAIFGFLTVPLVYFLAKAIFQAAHPRGVLQVAHLRGEIKTTPRPHLEGVIESAHPGGVTDLAHLEGEKPSIHLPQLEIGHLTFDIPTVAALLLALSPWHLQFSRVGFEATVGLFFAVAAITLFLYGLSRKKLLLISAVCLALSAYSYHTQRIFVPLLFIAAGIIFRKEILAVSKKYLLAFVAATIILALPLVILIPPKVILQRFEVTTGRPRLEDIEKSIRFILEDRAKGQDIGSIIHNRRLLIGQSYFGNYLSHFDPNFLFTKGDDNFRHHIQGMGMLYLFELPLVIYGIYLLIRQRTKASIFILLWLLLAPIAASPATPNPHANRSLPMIVALEIIAAYGLIALLAKNYLRPVTVVVFSLWISYSFATYLHNYWQHYPYEKASFWQYGYSQAVAQTEMVKDEYAKINVDRTIEQAYAFWLFNTRYDPARYQQEGSRYHFDKFYFDAKPPTDPKELFVADAGHFPGNFEVTKTIYYPDGSEAIKIGHPR